MNLITSHNKRRKYWDEPLSKKRKYLHDTKQESSSNYWNTIIQPPILSISSNLTWINDHEFVLYGYGHYQPQNGFYIYNVKTSDWRCSMKNQYQFRENSFSNIHFINDYIWAIYNCHQCLSIIDMKNKCLKPMNNIECCKNLIYDQNILHHICGTTDCNQWSINLNQNLENLTLKLNKQCCNICRPSHAICFYWKTQKQFILFQETGDIYIKNQNNSWLKLQSDHPLIRNMPQQFKQEKWTPATGAFDASDTSLILMAGFQSRYQKIWMRRTRLLNDIWIVNLQTNIWQKSSISTPFCGQFITCLIDKNDVENNYTVFGYIRQIEYQFKILITKSLQLMISKFIDNSNIYVAMKHSNEIYSIETDKLFITDK